MMLLTGQLAQAAPTGGQVTAGSGTISQSGATTTINQSSQNLSLSWQSFNTRANETVNFVQPSASAIAVNRIYDTNGTQFLGHLNANGQVYLINPNGVLFGQGAQVNVGGLVASTLDISDASLGSGTRRFSGTGTGSVVNQGAITTVNGGYVAFIGNRVDNQGTITAPGGMVALGGGNAVTLTFAGDSLVHMQVDQSTLNTLAQNGGLIQADGGMVLLTAGAKNALLASVVNNTGVIEARTVQNQNGTITLLGGMSAGTVNVGGMLDASAPDGGNGGAIETSAAHVHIGEGAKVTTASAMGLAGSWLLDPVDFNIAASGGDITGSALSAALGVGNVTIQTGASISCTGATCGSGTTGNGDINVNDTVTWSANTLTLNAWNNINVNTAMTGSGTASLALLFGQGAIASGNLSTDNMRAPVNLPAGNHLSTKLGSDGSVLSYYVITTLGAAGSTTTTDLQGMQGNLALNYALGANIDASTTSTWNAGAGFTPIGNDSTQTNATRFSGNFDGLGHTITGLVINRPTTRYVGFFGYTANGIPLRNIGLVNGNVTGETEVGMLAGYNYGLIINSYATGSVTGNPNGAVPYTTRQSLIGGLSGENTWSGAGGNVRNSYASVNVTAGTSSSFVGGLVGDAGGSGVANSYATGTVTTLGGYGIGGLAGYGGNINNSYATGNVSASSSTNVGGLIGYGMSPISNSYSLGSVSATGGASVGGLVGGNVGTTISNSYWNTNTSGLATSAGGVGMTTAQMKTQGTFTGAGWDFTNTWIMYSGTYPLLRALMTPLTVTANNATVTYSGTAYSGGNGVSYSLPGTPTLGGTLTYGGTSQGATATGTYTIIPSGLTSTQTGYVINYGQGTLTINPATLTVTVTGTVVANKVYDGTTTATLSGGVLNGVNPGDTVNLVQAGTFASKNVGTSIVVTANDSLTGAQASNYTLTQPTGLFANITQKALTESGLSVASSKVYDGSTSAVLSGTAALLAAEAAGAGTTSDGKAYTGDTVSITGTATGTYNSKDVATATYVSYGGLSLTGAQANNYSLTIQGNSAATITPKALTESGLSVASSKVYDGTTAAVVNGTAALLAAETAGTGTTSDGKAYTGDTVSLTGTATGTYNSKDVATASTVSYGGLSLTGAQAGNYSLTLQGNSAATVTAKALTATITAANKTYDATTTATPTFTITSGLVGTETVTASGTATFADKNVANGKVVTANTVTLANGTNGGLASNYTLAAGETTTANITAASLTVSGVSANNKVYDAGVSATLSGTATVTALGSDVVTVGGTGVGTFADKNVANGKTVTVTGYTLTGTDAGNYTIVQPSGLTANITPATLTLGGITAGNKVYDGTTTATLNTAGVTFTGLLSGDTVTLGGAGAGTFSDKNVANGKTITVSGYTLGGADSGNYSVGQPTGLTANITPATLTATLAASNKTYDGTTTATPTFTITGGLVGTETVTASGTATFADKNVANGKVVTANTVTLANGTNGGLAGNYTLAAGETTTANITPKALAVSGITASNKVYDGTTAATVSTAGLTLAGLVSGDSVTVSSTGTFSDKNVANGKTVTLVNTHSGADVNNYTITDQASTAANITAKALVLGGITAGNKVYDGTTSATLNTTGVTFIGLVSGDTVTLGGAGVGTFSDKNVANGKTVTVTGYALGGADSGNYSVSQPTGLTASITPKALAVSGITASNKTYDGTTAATVSTAGLTLAGLVSGDSVTVSSTGAFSDKNVANGKTVNLTSSHGGTDAGNYTITDQATTNANITPKALAVSGITASNKTYDGTTAATVSTAGVSLAGLVSGDNVSIGATGSFSDKNVANGKTVTLTSSHTGTDVNNYTITDQATALANITPKALAVSGITASNKTYDGTTAATVSTAGLTLAGLVSGDSVTVSSTGTFSDKNVANGKTVNLTSSHGGTDAGNYTITDQATTNANITPKALAVSGITASNKTYDGTTAATVSTAGVSLAGLVAGDTVTIGATGAFSDKNVANGKTVNLTSSHGGIDAGNYSITDQASTTASITPKALAVSGITASNKTYDGTTAATVSTAGLTLAGLVSGDSVTVSSTGTFSDKNVANGKTVTLSSSHSGADAGNYSITDQATTTANITAAPLTVIANDASKTYDGLPWYGGNGVTYVGFVGGENSAILGGTLAFGGNSQGAINIGGYTITPSGLAGSNYALRFVDGVLMINAQPVPPAQGIVSQLQMDTILPQVNPQPNSLDLSSTVNETQGTGSNNAGSGGADSPEGPAGGAPVVVGAFSSGGLGPQLTVQNGGMKMPGGDTANQQN